MKCSACSRRIAKPALVLAGAVFGPVCARKVLVAAGQRIALRAALRGEDHQQSIAWRDMLTKDLFDGVSA